MTKVPLAVRLAAPVVVALLVAMWLLWVRADPSRQGGYCTNATVVIAGVLREADGRAEVGRGPLPDAAAIFEVLPGTDVERLGVRTPAAVRDDVALLRRRLPELQPGADDPAVTSAFVRVAADYLDRCQPGG